MSHPIQPVRFDAEVSSNHSRRMDRCLRFIDVASEIGCDVVKFQLFKIDQLFAPEVLAGNEKLRRRKEWELPVEFLPELSLRCHERKIAFSCTPFYLKAVEELLPCVAFYKIASYELIWDDLLRECARTHKPVMLSTGMAMLEEVGRAVGILRESGCTDLTLLHCVSGYPCPVADCNLSAVETLRAAFPPATVGWSDHSVNADVIRRAVCRWGARVIEFHLDLDTRGEEFGGGHCWLPEQIAPVIAELRGGVCGPDAAPQPMDGDGVKVPATSELLDRDWRRDPVDGLRPLRSTRTRKMNG